MNNRGGFQLLCLCVALTLFGAAAAQELQASADDAAFPDDLPAVEAAVPPADDVEDAMPAEGAPVESPPDEDAPQHFKETAPPVVDTTVPPETPEKEAPDRVPDFFQAHQRIWDESEAPAPQETAPAPMLEPVGLWHFLPRMLIGLCVVCGLILLTGYIVRRAGRHSPLLAGPRLGAVLGRVYLAPKVTLHYLKTGGRVLIVAVTPGAVSLVADFDAEQFEAASAKEADAGPEEARGQSTSFLEQLQASAGGKAAPSAEGDDELAALRGDIQRLQRFLQEGSRDSRE